MPRKFNCSLIVDYQDAQKKLCRQIDSCKDCPIHDGESCIHVDSISPDKIARLQKWCDDQYERAAVEEVIEIVKNKMPIQPISLEMARLLEAIIK